MSTEATHPTTQQIAGSAPHGRRRSHIIASIFGLAQGAWVMALAAFVVKYQGPNFGFSYQAEQYLLALPWRWRLLWFAAGLSATMPATPRWERWLPGCFC